MKKTVKDWKNPYTRTANATDFPLENPISELNEEDLLNVNGGVQERWAEVVLTSLICFGASYAIGNNGAMCTTSVECQKSCK
ncbi:plantaricin C family lantibiotic [Priestia endophytica]|uniref:plantaricin C family lantibiotic n=1 Tax=Priestia endophytica TaxID=135735 RepID=UPI00124D2E19|nr:plantaricin C family lantibiotic [Priestia endophytica]KAB2489475.1 plantaricin C family lantibiotic [Priestia endophytica]